MCWGLHGRGDDPPIGVEADAVALWSVYEESLLVSSDASHHAGYANMLPTVGGRPIVVAQRRNVDVAWQSPAV